MARTDLKSALRTASRVDEGSRYEEAASRLVSGAEAAPGGTLQMIPIEKLVPNPDQPRKVFDEEALQELASSIKAAGLLQPVLVRQMPGGAYQIVVGERRWRACKIAGLERIPAVVQALTEQAVLEASIIENLQRADLSPLEEAQAFLRMTVELGYSIRRLAERLGKGKGYIEDRLRLARMGDDLQVLVAARPDTLTHAREIEQIEDVSLRADLIKATEAGAPVTEVRHRIQAAKRAHSATTESEQGTAQTPEEATASATLVSGHPDTRAAAVSPQSLLQEQLKTLTRNVRDLSDLSPPSKGAEREALREKLLAVRTMVEELLLLLSDGEVSEEP